MKKKRVGLLVLGCVGVFVGSAKAAATEDLILTVTPNGTKSITLSTGTLVLGTLALASTNNRSSSVTVTNDGTLECTLGLRIKTADPVWVSSSTAGADRYNLRALFNSVLPDVGDFLANDDVLTQGGAVLATGTGAVYSGNQDGQSFASGDTRGLWFKMDMPLTSTVGTQRSFTVEVSAN